MKISKKEIIELALEDEEVAKAIEAILRTKKLSEVRDVAAEIFEFVFCKVSTRIFEENIIGKVNKRVSFYVELGIDMKMKLVTVNTTKDEFIRFLQERDAVSFKVLIDGKSRIVITDIINNESLTGLFANFYLDADASKINEIALEIFNTISKR